MMLSRTDDFSEPENAVWELLATSKKQIVLFQAVNWHRGAWQGIQLNVLPGLYKAGVKSAKRYIAALRRQYPLIWDIAATDKNCRMTRGPTMQARISCYSSPKEHADF